MIVTRFAPSPTGPLHLGHVYSLLYSYNYSKVNRGKFLLRIEDIDFTRCKEKFVKEIINDINWLKIPFIRTKDQSLRGRYYTKALNKLKSMDLVYPCWLSRKEALDTLSAPHKNSLERTNVLLSEKEIIKRKKIGITPAWRLRIKKCLEYAKFLQKDLFWHDIERGRIKLDLEKFGDVIIARKDISTSYHLSVTIDDDADDVSHIIRGEDLFESTHIHRLLQILLNLRETKWLHHSLKLDNNGNRIAKRSGSLLTIKKLRESGLNFSEVINLANAKQNFSN